MKFILLLFIAVYATVGEHKGKDVDILSRQKRVDPQVKEIFQNENEAKDFLTKEKREPGHYRRKYKKYGRTYRPYRARYRSGIRIGSPRRTHYARYRYHGGGGGGGGFEDFEEFDD